MGSKRYKPLDRHRQPTGVSSIGWRLQSLGYKNYAEYLRGEHWKAFRVRFFTDSAVVKKMRRKFGHAVCEVCSMDNRLNVHHKTYKRLGAERLDDVRLLCDRCHQLVHERQRQNPRKGLWAASKLKLKHL